MAASLKATGTWARIVADPSSVTIPGSPAAGDRMFLFVSWKDFSINIAAIGGWTSLGKFSDGSLNAGNGTGSVSNQIFYRDWQSGDGNPSVNWSTAPTEGHAVIQVWQKGASEVWDTPVVVNGAISAASPFTCDAGTTADVPDGSVVLALVGLRDDSTTLTRTTTAISDSGGLITWNGDYVESPATHFNSTTGQDMSGDLGHRFVTTGATGVTLRATGTPVAGETGSTTWLIEKASLAAIQGSFTLDAVLKQTISSSFVTDAVIFRTYTAAFTLDSLFLKSSSGSFAVDAIIQRAVTASLSLDAVLFGTISSSFTTNAIILRTVTGVPYQTLILADSPISYWRLGEASGTLFDGPGSNDLAPQGGPTYGVDGLLVGDPNDAVSFNGQSAVDFSFTGLPTGNSPWSIEAWIDTTATADGGVVGWGAQSGNQDASLRITAAGALAFFSHSETNTFGGDVNDGNPHHVVLTYDGTLMKGYIDGSQIGTDWDLTNALAIAAGAVAVASWTTNFAGIIDEPAIYGSALTSAQVAAHYAAGTTGAGPTLNAYINAPVSSNFTLNATFFGTTTSSFSFNAAIAQLVAFDDFSRTVAGGWGTGTSGFKWIPTNFYYGDNGETPPRVDGSVGIFGPQDLGFVQFSGPPILQSGIMQFDFYIPNPVAGTDVNYNFDFYGGLIDLGYSVGQWRVNGTGTVNIPNTVLSVSPDTWYTAKVHGANASGVPIYFKYWAVGNPEPEVWTASGTSSTPSAPLNAYYFGADSTRAAKFDNFKLWTSETFLWTYNIFTFDAIKFRTTSATRTLDAVLMPKATLDAILLRTVQASATFDAVVFRTEAASWSLDSVLLKQVAASFSLDAVLAGTFTLDAFLTGVSGSFFTIDAILFRTTSTSATFDAVLFKTTSASFTADAVVMPRAVLDAVLLRMASTTFTLDASIIGEGVFVLTIDAIVEREQTASFSLDSIIRRTVSEGSTLDASILRTQIASFSTDAIVKRTATATLTLDAVLLRSRTASFVLDALQLKISSAGFTTDAVTLATRTAGFTLDSVVLSVQQASFSLGAMLSELRTASFAFDALIEQVVPGSFSTEAVLKKIVERQLTIDAILQTTRDGSFLLDAYVAESVFRNFSLDASFAGTQSRSFIAAAYLITPPSGIVDPISAVFAADTLTATLSAETLLGEPTADTLEAI